MSSFSALRGDRSRSPHRLRPAARPVRAGATLAGLSVVAALLAVPTGSAAAAVEVDVTDFPGTVSAAYTDSPTGQTLEEGVDNLAYSKYLTFNPTTWLQFTAQSQAVVTRYSITSANDFAGRDPRNWTLRGSNDGNNWTPLDTRTGQTFTARFQERSFSFTNSAGYRYFRLDVTANNGDGITQLAEWRLFGQSATVAPLTAPTNLTAQAVSGDQIVLNWRNVARSQTSFRLERSTDGVNWTPRTLLPGTTRTWHDTLLNGTTMYRYRLRAQNASGSSAWTPTVTATTLSQTPPATYQPTDHTTPFNLRYSDADVAIYTDNEVGQNHQWLNSYVGNVWRYTKQTYGDIGTPRLYAVLHGNPVHSATPHDIYDATYRHRTAIDASSYDWSQTNDDSKDRIAHEIAHLVEFFNGSVQGSPSFPLWGDSMWAEIYQYDVYLKLGMSADAQRWRTAKLNNPQTFPRAGTQWFRDWFLPIYDQYGQTAVLKRYIDLVRTQYPTVNQRHPHDMTWGEFVHFWSGATGVNQQPRAQTAFGWSAEWQTQLDDAKRTFPGITYRAS